MLYWNKLHNNRILAQLYFENIVLQSPRPFAVNNFTHTPMSAVRRIIAKSDENSLVINVLLYTETGHEIKVKVTRAWPQGPHQHPNSNMVSNYKPEVVITGANGHFCSYNCLTISCLLSTKRKTSRTLDGATQPERQSVTWHMIMSPLSNLTGNHLTVWTSTRWIMRCAERCRHRERIYQGRQFATIS